MSEIVLNPELDLTVDAHEVSAEFARLPLLIYRYSLQYVEAKKLADMAEAYIKEAQGQEYLNIKAGTEKVTEAHLTALIAVSKSVKAAKAAHAQAEADADTIKSILEALRAKKDALVSIGAAQRAEMK